MTGLRWPGSHLFHKQLQRFPERADQMQILRDRWQSPIFFFLACVRQEPLKPLRIGRETLSISLEGHTQQKHKHQERKSSPQRGSVWNGYPADIQGSFARISRAKTSVRALETLWQQAFWRGHPWPEGADVHDPKGLPTFRYQKNFGLNFHSLQQARTRMAQVPSVDRYWWCPWGTVRVTTPADSKCKKCFLCVLEIA